jgi:hypothetical protein
LNNENNISLQALQNHEVAPPAFLLQNIKSKIADVDIVDLKNTFAPLYNHSAIPAGISFEQIMQKIKATEQINIFQKLNSYEKDAPISFARIMERLRELGYFKPTTSAKVVSFNFVKKLVAAAAVLLFLVAGYFMFNKTSSTAEGTGMTSTNNNATNTNPITPNNSAIDLPVVNDTIPTTPNIINENFAQNNPINPTPNSNKTNSKENKKEKIAYSKVKNNNYPKNIAPKQQSFTLNGENFTILENDYLATFASFTSDKLPLFLQAETPVETQITVDKYSYFNVTEGMGAMMKKMYATKSSGAPTRSAKKQKLKLENWKKADSTYFIPNSNLNPLDPRDLGNLILNK